jgi:hypothetical protein
MSAGVGTGKGKIEKLLAAKVSVGVAWHWRALDRCHMDHWVYLTSGSSLGLSREEQASELGKRAMCVQGTANEFLACKYSVPI